MVLVLLLHVIVLDVIHVVLNGEEQASWFWSYCYVHACKSTRCNST